MKTDKITKSLLLGIALLLAIGILRPAVLPVAEAQSGAAVDYSRLQVSVATWGYLVFDEQTGNLWGYTKESSGGAVTLFGKITELGRSLQKPDGTTASAPKRETITRDEAKKKFMGMTKDQILKQLGKPSRTYEGSLGDTWYYDNLTVDPVSGKTDYSTIFEFRGDSVKDVRF